MSFSFTLLPLPWPRPVLGLLVLVGLGSTAPQEGRRERDAFARGDVNELFIGRAVGTSVSYYRIDPPRPEDAEAAPRGARPRPPIGVARFSSTSGRGFGEHRSEFEVQWFELGTLLSHVETRLPGERKLIWREVRPRSGRTLMARGAQSSGFSISDASGGDVVRSTVHPGRALLPLELVEAVRRGEVYLGTFPVFQPLSAQFEPLVVDTRETQDDDGRPTRVLRLLEPGDEVPRASYRFQNSKLVGFSWRADGPVGTLISGKEYEGWVERQRPLTDPESRRPAAAPPRVQGPNPPR